MLIRIFALYIKAFASSIYYSFFWTNLKQFFGCCANCINKKSCNYDLIKLHGASLNLRNNSDIRKLLFLLFRFRFLPHFRYFSLRFQNLLSKSKILLKQKATLLEMLLTMTFENHMLLRAYFKLLIALTKMLSNNV